MAELDCSSAELAALRDAQQVMQSEVTALQMEIASKETQLASLRPLQSSVVGLQQALEQKDAEVSGKQCFILDWARLGWVGLDCNGLLHPGALC